MKKSFRLLIALHTFPVLLYSQNNIFIGPRFAIQPAFSSDVIQNAAAHSLPIKKDQRQAWQQAVRYQIEAMLDTAKQALEGTMFISYTNHSPDTLKRIYLQVPANAFADEQNTAVKEMQRFQSRNVRIRFRRGTPLTIQGLQFHSIGSATDFPLRAYKFGDTILDWPLPLALLPGDSLTMSIVFTVDCKELFKNTKPDERQLDFVLWLPRLCVYDQDGWHAEPFHFMMSTQAVFAEVADVDVQLTVPGNYVVVSSGESIDGDAGGEASR